MSARPLQNHRVSPGWGFTPDETDGLESDDDFLSFVEGVNVGAVGWLVEHPYGDSIELGQNGHGIGFQHCFRPRWRWDSTVESFSITRAPIDLFQLLRGILRIVEGPS